MRPACDECFVIIDFSFGLMICVEVMMSYVTRFSQNNAVMTKVLRTCYSFTHMTELSISN